MIRLGLFLFVALTTSAASAECKLAPVLSGDVSLFPMNEPGVSLIRNARISREERFGSIRGLLMASDEGTIVFNRDGLRVGIIEPKTGHLDSEEADDCTKKMFVRYAEPNAGILLNDGTPIGTIKGRLPK